MSVGVATSPPVRLPVLPPRTRGDCLPGGANAARPCRWSECRFHLQAEQKERVGEAAPSCCLDLADQQGATLEEVGKALGVTRERVRQVSRVALRRLAKNLVARGVMTQAEAERFPAMIESWSLLKPGSTQTEGADQ